MSANTNSLQNIPETCIIRNCTNNKLVNSDYCKSHKCFTLKCNRQIEPIHDPYRIQCVRCYTHKQYKNLL